MSLRFIIGRAGTGKSQHCLASIVSTLKERPLGEEIILLLPRQATFDAQRRLACGGDLPGFCGVRVESFDELAAELMAECGGKAIPQVSTLGRQMILGHLLRKNKDRLKYFAKVAAYPSLAARLEGALSEFDRCGTEPQKLAEVAANFRNDGEATIDSHLLSAKLHDLQLMYEAYCQYLGQERLDPRRRMEHLLRCIDSSSRVRRATVYVDEFLEFTDLERRMLARIAKRARHVDVTMLMDPSSSLITNPQKFPDDGSLFHRTEWTYRRMRQALAEEGVTVQEPIPLTKPKRVKGESLALLESSFFSFNCDHAVDGNIQLIEAPDRRAEVEAAARQVAALTSSGYRLRDIALLVRRLDDYVDLLESTLREHQIPFFVDHRRTMAHHPLLVVIRSVLLLALKNWPHDAVMQLIKSGLAGLATADADCLENYVLEHRLRGGTVWTRKEPWTWCRRIARGGDADATSALADPSPAMDALRRKIADTVLPFTDQFQNSKATASIRETATALFGVLGRFGVRKSIAKWIQECRETNEHEWAAEHEQIWAEVSSLFQQLVELLGNEQVSLEEFAQIVEAGLETFDLALAPPTADQLLVGAIDRTRTGPVKAVLLLGWSDGLFPSSARELSLLSDAERSELQRRDIAIEPNADRQRLDEDLLAYIAVTRASERVYVSRPVGDEQKRACAPSPYWIRLRGLFPRIEVRLLPRNEADDPAVIGTPRQLLTSLLHWARDGGQIASEHPWAVLYQWLATYPAKDDAIDSIRFRAWKALSYRNDSILSRENGQRTFASPLRASVSQMETFATCAFKHFLHYGLSLHQRVEEEHLDLDLDRAFHATLSDLVGEMLRKRIDWSQLSTTAAAEMVEKYTRQIGQTLSGELMLSNARNRYLLNRIQDTLEQIIAQQREITARSDLKPAHVNIQYGSSESPLVPLRIKTPGGKEAELRGQIDRVDILEQQAGFAIFDYRLYSNPLNLNRVRHGLSLGLLASLAIVQEQSQRLTNKKLSPAAAFYLKLLRQLEKVDHPADAHDPEQSEFHLTAKPRGVFNADFFPSLDHSCETGKSAVLAATLTRQGEFGYRNNSDVAEAAEFAALLKDVRKQLGQLADQIMDGDVAIRPYRMGTTTPCPDCRYRSVCRFDPSINRYRNIQPARRDQVLKELAEEHRE